MTDTPDDDRPELRPPSTEQLPAVVRDEYRRGRTPVPASSDAADDNGYGQLPPKVIDGLWPGSPASSASLGLDSPEARPLPPVPGIGDDSEPDTEDTVPVHVPPRPPSGPGLGGRPAPGSRPSPGSSPGNGTGRRIPSAGTPGGGGTPPSTPAADPGEAASRSAPAAKGEIKIGLWGSPQSGKTTYLAALRHTLGVQGGESGKWNLLPRSKRSAELMTKYTTDLVAKRQFPQATPLDGWSELQWEFTGDIAGTKFDTRPRFRRGKPLRSKFVLDLIDVSGGAFDDDLKRAGVGDRVADKALDHLQRAQGIIYLFDPVQEKADRNAAEYVNRTLVELLRRHADESQEDPYLPHHLAVCITKFDHPKVFQRARDLGFVNHGADGIPRVRDEHAAAFFDAVCAGDFWGDHDEASAASAQFVRTQLSAAFDPSRVQYYVTSSIGFRQPSGWRPNAAASTQFDPESFSNYHERPDGSAGILGAIRPINVLEPLVSLSQRIKGRD